MWLAGGDPAEPASLPVCSPHLPYPCFPCLSASQFLYSSPGTLPGPPEAGSAGLCHQGELWAHPPQGGPKSRVQTPELTLDLQGAGQPMDFEALDILEVKNENLMD